MNDSFILYTSDYQLIEGLTDEQLGQLTRALFVYARDGEVINLEPVVRMAFVFIKDKIDRNQQKYQKKCERNRENIRKRWNKSNTNDTKENERIPNDTSVYERIPNDTTRYLYDSDSDSDSDSDVSKETDNKPSKEGILSASVKTEAPAGGKVSKSQKIDYAGIKEYWNRKHEETKSVMPPITLMTENRKVMVKARLRQCKGDVKTLYRAIDIAMASDFMNGNNKKGWLGKFDWIFGNEQNFAKVLEGNFNNTEPAASQQPQGATMAQDPAATARPSIGELYEQAKHQQPASQQSQDDKFRWVIQQNLADLKKNPRNKPAKDSLTRYYERGVLQRLGIDWKPEK